MVEWRSWRVCTNEYRLCGTETTKCRCSSRNCSGLYTDYSLVSIESGPGSNKKCSKLPNPDPWRLWGHRNDGNSVVERMESAENRGNVFGEEVYFKLMAPLLVWFLAFNTFEISAQFQLITLLLTSRTSLQEKDRLI